MDFSTFATHATNIGEASSDLETISRTATLLKGASADSDDTVEIAARFIHGEIFSPMSSLKVDIGPSTMYKSIGKATVDGLSGDDVEDLVIETGEVGDAMLELDFGGQAGLGAFGAGSESDTTTLQGLYNTFEEIANTSGSGSESRKVNSLFSLFSDVSAEEARILARMVMGEMRIGVGEGTVRDGIAEAFSIPNDIVERGLQVANDVGLVAKVAATEGNDGVSGLSLEIGRPVQSMKAPVGEAEEAVADYGVVAVNPKLDGARAQVHFDGESAEIYSRNMENVTDAIPEVADYVEEHVQFPCILDGEVVAMNDDGSPRPFEDVLRRFRRQDNVQEMRNRVPVVFFPFDCLHGHGRSLIDDSFRDRYSILTDLYPEDDVTSTWYVESPSEVTELLSQALDDGHEGLMLKDPESPYTPGERGADWYKLKPEMETLDLVIIGGKWGSGSRGQKVGSLLLGARTDGGEFLPVGRAGTGFDEADIDYLTDSLDVSIEDRTDGREFSLPPKVVIEVDCQDIQESPEYDSGYSLRFPSFKEYRDDKSVSDADSVSRISSLYEKQHS